MVKKRKKDPMILITIHLTREQIESLDRLVEAKIFPNRSEAIRTAVIELIDRYTLRTRGSIGEYMIGL